MRHNPARAFPDLSKFSDRELIDGSCGVFASNWVDVKQEPERTANYLVVVRAYEPVIALFIKGIGWDLANTRHEGLEHLVRMWMELPKGQRNEQNT
jgi:hypothetical protein